MIRDEKGRFTTSGTETKEVNLEEQIKATETKLAELKKVQAAKAEEEKKVKALAKKAEAEPVQKAIDDYEAAKVACNDEIKVAYEEYQSKVHEAEKRLNNFQAIADKKLNDFLENHPEGFHYTYRSPDGKVTREYSYYNHRYDVFDDFKRIQDVFNSLWNW